MKKKQLELWLKAYKKEHQQCPKVFILSCANLSRYSLAVEFKHKIEPILLDGEAIYFSSLECAKEELKRIGLEFAYLRVTNVYDELGCPEFSQTAQDIELPLAS